VNVDVLVVGAGPAGLTAAAELRHLGVGSVLVADREAEPGGIPRHSWHTGYGLRDLHRVMTGPAYARALADAVVTAGVSLRLGTTVTGWSAAPDRPGGHAVRLVSERGLETVQAAAVLLATGCRERPRAARLVPGDRPAGVMTTGELQQRVYLGGERVPGRALVVGAEHVSFSAAVTLAHAGARIVALVTDQERQQSYAAFRLGAALRWRVPVWTSTEVRRVVGSGRLAGVEVAEVRTGGSRFVPCDTLVFSGDWIPDYELARMAGLALDPGTRGPEVDTTLATSAAGVFAAGNLVHAAETADIAALSGRHAARHIAAVLKVRPRRTGQAGTAQAGTGRAGTAQAGTGQAGVGQAGAGQAGLAGAGQADAGTVRLPVLVGGPLQWISPNAITVAPGQPAPSPPLGRFVLRSQEFRRLARLELRQDGRLLGRPRWVRLIPGRPAHLGAGWLPRVDPAGGPVYVAVSA
jgi:thioredoxin reductase